MPQLYRVLSLLLVSCYCFSCYTQEYNFQIYGLEDGVPQSQVFCIEQDYQGFVWMGTNSGGAVRFDGKEFKVYTKEEHGLSNNLVRDIKAINQDQLWFATLNGISIFNGHSFIELPNELEKLNNKSVQVIQKDNLGRIWIGTTDGIYEYADNELYEHKAFKDASITSIYQDSKNNLWFCTSNIGVIRSKGGVFKNFNINHGLPPSPVNTIIEKDKTIYVGTHNGLYAYNKQADFFNQVNIIKENINTDVRILYEDNLENLWVGTYGKGIYQINTKSIVHFTEENGLPNMGVLEILQDREGNIWFGTDGGGTVKYGHKMFVTYSQESGLPADIILSLLQDTSGNMWFGTYNGAVLYNGKSYKVFNSQNGFADKKVWSVTQLKNGNIMLATYGEGIYIYSNGVFSSMKKENGLASNNVRAIFQDSQGKIWIGTSAGINTILPDGTIETYTEEDGLPVNRILAFHQDKEGNIWIATSGGGVVKYDGKKFITINISSGLADETVLSLTEDDFGNIWCAHYAGVSCINKETLKPKNISKKDGLASNTTYIVAYDKNKLLIGTNDGLDILNAEHFHKNKKVNVNHYGKAEGYKGVECNTNAKYRDNKGNIWFGTINGAVKYIPELHVERPALPPIHIQNVRLKLQNINWSDREVSTDASTGLPEELFLEYNDNYITFDYVGIKYKSPEKVTYTVKLEGFDEQWSPPIKERFITYNNLPPGKYTFKVKAIYQNNIHSERPASFSFTILPPFWERWWFLLLMVATAGVLLYVFVKAWYKRVDKKQQFLQQQVDIKTRELNLEKQKAEIVNKELAKKNQDVTSSISYAKQIQNAVLVKIKEFQNLLPKSFIFFKPKDIVSGDFYWVAELEDEVLIAVVDCTGHGVPGAFMSLVGNELLNKAVKEKKLTDPSIILNDLHNGIAEVFKQDEREKASLIGMDISLCTFNRKNYILRYAGTGRPIIYFHNDKMNMVKTGKHPIGTRLKKQRNYRSELIQLQKGDTFYMFTDGYCDQFGEKTGEKFMYDRFQKMLQNMYKKDMDEQLSIVSNTMEDWQGKEKQLDDMCLIGIRI